MPIFDHYEFTDCARKAIRDYYPKSMSEPNFSRGQKVLQAALIRCHFANMDKAAQERAMNTLKFLDA